MWKLSLWPALRRIVPKHGTIRCVSGSSQAGGTIISTLRLARLLLTTLPPVLQFLRTAHSRELDCRLSELHIKVIPALKNNYMYLIVDIASREAAAVDPVDPPAIFKALKAENVHLTTVFVTHHHGDHSAGNEQLASLCSECLKICAGDPRIPAVTHFLRNNEQLTIGNLSVQCLHTPCHTIGHYCYFVQARSVAERALFTGDTLFQAGCGGFDEGTPQQMYEIIKTFCALPDDTFIFGGHENTVLNLEYAAQVEPTNDMVCQRLHWAEQQRKENLPTVPSRLWQEKCFNPFMRVDHDNVQKYTGDTDPIYAMYFLRKQRDHFKVNKCK